MHKFVIMVNRELITYSKYEDIPDHFDHVIEFVPEIPNGPHTHEQHEEIHLWNQRLQDLISKENKKYASSN
jgi:hypothetical protein